MFNSISILSLELVNYLVRLLSASTFSTLFLVSMLVIIFLVMGKKLSKFSKPEWPLLSPVVRKVSFIVYCFGYLASISFTIYVLILIVFTELGFILASSVSVLSASEILVFGALALWKAMKSVFYAVLLGSGLGLSISLFFVTRIIPNFERGEGLHDINHLVKTFSKLNGYNPMPWIDIKRGCFVGLDANKKPIYVSWKKIRETHIQVIGTTGCGKGVVISLIAYQAVLAGEGLVWIDPKFDRFSPRILAAAAKQAAKNFYLINLNPEQPSQLNPFAGAEAFEIEELLVSAFDLKGKGTDGDFHRGKDEDAAIEASRLAIEKKALSIPELIQVCRSVESITSQENFWRKLCKLGDLEAIITTGGVSLKDAISSGAAIYIVGSTDNERVKMLQKLLLVRINQIIKKQDRFKKQPPTCIVLDEFKHVLSPTALTGLGVIRDYDAHCLLAHQSLGDLDSCAGITRAEAEGAVLDNTAIKIVYRLGDSSYAEKLSKNSGKRVVFVEQSGKNLDENSNSEGGWREMHVPLIDPDVLTHLPMPSDRGGQASVGVLFGVGVARLFHVGHIPIRGSLPAIKIAQKHESESSHSAGDLI